MIRQDSSLADEFQDVALGDVRRGRRFRAMLGCLAARPAGRVSDVYRCAGQRQGAYDFLEHDGASVEAVQMAAGRATARRCASFDSVYVALDGSSLTLTDRGESKDFGSIGPRMKRARGMKVLNALALGPKGQTVGVLSQCFGRARPQQPKDTGRFASARAAIGMRRLRARGVLWRAARRQPACMYWPTEKATPAC